MSESNMIVFHILRNYAPSNLNRDDEGAPKRAMFGGFMRGRISSQSIKRSLRTSAAFDGFRDEGLIDYRTRALPQLVAEELLRQGVTKLVSDDVVSKLQELGKKVKEKSTTDEGEEKEEKLSADLSTKQLIRISPAAIKTLCAQLLALRETGAWKNNIEKIIQPIDFYGIDTALFGAMTTSAAFSNVRSACQVSHALSVNKNGWGEDYFTAVDDLSGETAMIGKTQFNSNTYYLAVAVSMSILAENLQGDQEMVKRTLSALVESLFTAHPGGMQNTFFSQPAISLFMAEKRQCTVMDYANAFELPIEPTKSDSEHKEIVATSLVQNSIAALSDYIGKVDAMYAPTVDRAHVSMHNVTIPQSSNLESMDKMIEWVTG